MNTFKRDETRSERIKLIVWCDETIAWRNEASYLRSERTTLIARLEALRVACDVAHAALRVAVEVLDHEHDHFDWYAWRERARAITAMKSPKREGG